MSVGTPPALLQSVPVRDPLTRGPVVLPPPPLPIHPLLSQIVPLAIIFPLLYTTRNFKNRLFL